MWPSDHVLLVSHTYIPERILDGPSSCRIYLTSNTLTRALCWQNVQLWAWHKRHLCAVFAVHPFIPAALSPWCVLLHGGQWNRNTHTCARVIPAKVGHPRITHLSAEVGMSSGTTGISAVFFSILQHWCVSAWGQSSRVFWTCLSSRSCLSVC